jgi:hypothetical protein
MPGLLGGIARTAVVAGTWTAVSNGVSRRQAGRWAAQGQAPAGSQAPAAAQQAYAQRLAMPPPPGRYNQPLFQPAPPPYTPRAPVSPPAPPVQPAPRTDDSTDARLRQLRQLGELKAQGVLTDAEFETQKRKLLGA